MDLVLSPVDKEDEMMITNLTTEQLANPHCIIDFVCSEYAPGELRDHLFWLKQIAEKTDQIKSSDFNHRSLLEKHELLVKFVEAVYVLQSRRLKSTGDHTPAILPACAEGDSIKERSKAA